MTAGDVIGRVIRPMLVVGGILPAMVLVWRLVSNNLGANPAEELEHATGFTALVFLLSSLAATPLRRLTGVAQFTRLRKPLGLWAFGYAVLHMLCYLVFDQSLLWGEILTDIAKRPYITVGFSAFLILLVLAATSPAAVMKRLGGKRWQAIHRMAYVAGVLAVFHFLWLVKLDMTRPLIAAAILVGLLVLRRPPRTPASETRAPVAAGAGSAS